jgi:serine/threonine protein kinase
MFGCVSTFSEHLHERLKIIHTDLKPENVLCTLPLAQVHTLVERL